MGSTKRFQIEFTIRRNTSGGWWINLGLGVFANNYGIVIMLGAVRIGINFKGGDSND